MTWVTGWAACLVTSRQANKKTPRSNRPPVCLHVHIHICLEDTYTSIQAIHMATQYGRHTVSLHLKNKATATSHVKNVKAQRQQMYTNVTLNTHRKVGTVMYNMYKAWREK